MHLKRALVRGHKWGHSCVPCGAVSIFDSESIICYLSEGICVMKADANSNKRKKQHNSSEKAKANPCSDAIITHNQIRADLNRHRTQNHIKGNSMCMALHCSQSPLCSFSAPLSPHSLFDFVTPFLPVLLSICHHHHRLPMFQCQWPEKCVASDLYGRFLLSSLILCFLLPAVSLLSTLSPRDKLC